MALTWNDIFTTGSLIHFSRHQWEARAKLSNSDLGIEATLTDDGDKSVNRTLKLARAKRFKKIEECRQAFKNEIESRSLNFPVLESVRYVPDTQVSVLRENLDRINREFTEAVDDFVAKFYDIKSEGLEDARLVLLNECRNPDAAASAFARVSAEYPDAEKIRVKFGLEFDFFTIQMPVSEAAAAAAKETAPQVKSVIESMVTQLRTELGDKLADLIKYTDKAMGGGTVNMKSINSALELLNKCDQLNFLGDDTLTQQVSLLKNLLQNAKDSKDSKQDLNLGELFTGLSKAQAAVSGDMQAAVDAAERKLTGFGSRKIG